MHTHVHIEQTPTHLYLELVTVAKRWLQHFRVGKATQIIEDCLQAADLCVEPRPRI